MESASGYAVRPYRAGDEAEIVALFNRVFPRTITLDHYRWKLARSRWPLDVPWVWLAEAEGRIVGQYAGTPMRFRLTGRDRMALHGCDVMTAPEFRRRGVLTALGQAAHRAWAGAGVALVTGLHYGGWGSRRHHLGWREQFPARWLWLPLRPGEVLARRGRLTPGVARAVDHAAALWRARARQVRGVSAAGVEVEPISRAGTELDALWAHVAPNHEALVVRDAAWVNYRYVDAPDRSYRVLVARRATQLVGYVASRTASSGEQLHGWIADVFTAPHDPHARSALLNGALRTLEESGAVDVRVLMPRAHPAWGALRRRGFIRRSGSYDVSIVPLAPDLPLGVLADPTRWLSIGGDFDVV